MTKLGNLRTHEALSHGTDDVIGLIYQTIADWLKHVETKLGKPLAELCQKKIEELGFKETDQMCQLPIDSSQIIEEARQKLASGSSPTRGACG